MVSINHERRVETRFFCFEEGAFGIVRGPDRYVVEKESRSHRGGSGEGNGVPQVAQFEDGGSVVGNAALHTRQCWVMVAGGGGFGVCRCPEVSVDGVGSGE